MSPEVGAAVGGGEFGGAEDGTAAGEPVLAVVGVAFGDGDRRVGDGVGWCENAKVICGAGA